MKKSRVGFLVIGSMLLLACQIQYLISGQPTSETESPKSKSTATVNVRSSVSGSTQSQSPAGATQTFVTAIDDLVLRSTASSVAPPVGELRKGDVAQVMARTATNDWFQVMVLSSLMMIPGWVPANQVIVDGPLDKIQVVQPSAPPSSSQAVPPTPVRQTYPSSSQPPVPTAPRKTYP